MYYLSTVIEKLVNRDEDVRRAERRHARRAGARHQGPLDGDPTV